MLKSIAFSMPSIEILYNDDDDAMTTRFPIKKTGTTFAIYTCSRNFLATKCQKDIATLAATFYKTCHIFDLNNHKKIL